MTSQERINIRAEVREDARDTAENFLDEMCAMWRDDRELSTDLNNDYSGGDSYHHETHTDKSYSLTEAAAVLDELSDHEETDSGLWEGLSPREAISAQAAYTYGNAVYGMWRELVEKLQDQLEEVQSAIEGNPPMAYAVQWRGDIEGDWTDEDPPESFPTEEEAMQWWADHYRGEDEYGNKAYLTVTETEADTEEAVSVAGERYLRLYFVLDGMEDGDFGAMVGAAKREAKGGEFTAALVLADAIDEHDDPVRAYETGGKIRAAVK